MIAEEVEQVCSSRAQEWYWYWSALGA